MSKKYAFKEDELHAEDLRLALLPANSLTTAQKKRIYLDFSYPEKGRKIDIIRELPVKHLTEDECRRLLVHSHSCGNQRRKAYLLKSAGKNWSVYFGNVTEASKIQQFINEENPETITH